MWLRREEDAEFWLVESEDMARVIGQTTQDERLSGSAGFFARVAAAVPADLVVDRPLGDDDLRERCSSCRRSRSNRVSGDCGGRRAWRFARCVDSSTGLPTD